jgi:hypothetical protein
LGVTLSAAALAVAGSLAVLATPAHAADEPQGSNCVITVPETNVRCFETYEEAKAFIAGVAETTADNKPSAAAQRAYGDAMKASPLVFWPVWIFTGFDYENYNLLNPFGGSLSVIALNGPCTTSIGNVDYELPSLGRWDNDFTLMRDHEMWKRGGGH